MSLEAGQQEIRGGGDLGALRAPVAHGVSANPDIGAEQALSNLLELQKKGLLPKAVQNLVIAASDLATQLTLPSTTTPPAVSESTAIPPGFLRLRLRLLLLRL